jgi:hypothetical protein
LERCSVVGFTVGPNAGTFLGIVIVTGIIL